MFSILRLLCCRCLLRCWGSPWERQMKKVIINNKRSPRFIIILSRLIWFENNFWTSLKFSFMNLCNFWQRILFSSQISKSYFAHLWNISQFTALCNKNYLNLVCQNLYVKNVVFFTSSLQTWRISQCCATGIYFCLHIWNLSLTFSKYLSLMKRFKQNVSHRSSRFSDKRSMFDS